MAPKRNFQQAKNQDRIEYYDGEKCTVLNCEEKCWCCGIRKYDEFIFWQGGRVICRGCNGF